MKKEPKDYLKLMTPALDSEKKHVLFQKELTNLCDKFDVKKILMAWEINDLIGTSIIGEKNHIIIMQQVLNSILLKNWGVNEIL